MEGTSYGAVGARRSRLTRDRVADDLRRGGGPRVLFFGGDEADAVGVGGMRAPGSSWSHLIAPSDRTRDAAAERDLIVGLVRREHQRTARRRPVLRWCR